MKGRVVFCPSGLTGRATPLILITSVPGTAAITTLPCISLDVPPAQAETKETCSGVIRVLSTGIATSSLSRIETSTGSVESVIPFEVATRDMTSTDTGVAHSSTVITSFTTPDPVTVMVAVGEVSAICKLPATSVKVDSAPPS